MGATALGPACALYVTVEIPVLDVGRRVVTRRRAKAAVKAGVDERSAPYFAEPTRLATTGQARPRNVISAFFGFLASNDNATLE